MDAQRMRDCVHHIEQHADEAKRAAQSPGVSQPLRECVEMLHQQAREAKTRASEDEGSMRGGILQLEQAADRALEMCRSSTNVDARLQQAIQSLHDESLKLKKQMETA